MDQLQTMASKTPKSFWAKKEGKFVGIPALLAIAAGVVYGGNIILPAVAAFFGYLALTFTSAIAATVAGVALVLLWMIITNKTVHTLVRYAFKSFCRGVASAFVAVDPIGIMRGYIDDMRKKKEVFEEHKGSLRGQISLAKKKVAENDKEIEAAMAMMSVAKAKNNTLVLQQQSRHSERLSNYNATIKDALNKMEMMYKALVRYAEVVEVVIADLISEVKITEDRMASMKAMYGAISAVKSILSNTTDERMLFDMAMEHTQLEYETKMGEIDDFMDVTKSLLEGVDLQNGVMEAKALEKLAAWEAKSDTILMSQSEKRLLVENSQGVYIPQQLLPGQPVPVAQDLSGYFKR